MTIGFFLFEGFWVGEMRHFGGRRKKQMKWQGEKMNRLKPNIRRSTGLDEMPVPQKNFEISLLAPHTITNLLHTHVHTQSRPLPWFWTTEDVISHISKVWEETRDCSPFRNAGILSLRRNISSWAHYDISLRQYWKQHVSSVSLCLSLTWPQRWR